MKLKGLLAAVALSAALPTPASADFSGNVVKIGVLTDMSGPFSHQTGPGSVAGAELAIAEIKGKIGDVPVELVLADHQNKPDIALNLARRWLDVDGVDLIVDLASSAVALAVQDVVKEKNRMVIFSGPGTDRLTNDACSPNGIHWTYDTYATGHSMAQAIIESGGKNWFFIGNDSAFGRSIVEVMSGAIAKASGKVVGEVWHPTGANDYSSFIMQAQSSGADVLVLANSGTDFVRAVKQAREFGVDGDALRLVGPSISMADILALGPEDAEGLHYIDAFYWNLNDKTRELTNAFLEKRQAIPAQAHAGVYSAVRSYLAVVSELKSDEASAVMEKLGSTEISDGFTPSGKIRADGRMVHDMYLMRAKGPDADKTADWDAVELVATVPGDKAYRPLAESQCPLVK
ncbi:ABC transporter substrate-binding protein [Arvimicrobium flavum]|uniref:ABC transporter substrate-binding protein n=1 Tax=Arvimicrobium flavum TaxID=3393320 RepID=UPI00237C440F|nr:ABC transporter substrate-binding protein [Mesorhizobium shangrilense]